jgi:hypothetical protein
VRRRGRHNIINGSSLVAAQHGHLACVQQHAKLHCADVATSPAANSTQGSTAGNLDSPSLPATSDNATQTDDMKQREDTAQPENTLDAQTESPLMALPPETRNRMYRLVLVEADPNTIRSHPVRLAPTPPALLQTCQQIRQEASSIYYQENLFRIHVHDFDATLAIRWMLQSRRSQPNDPEGCAPEEDWLGH